MTKTAPTTNDALKAAVESIHKKYGDTSIMRLGDKPEMDIEVIPSGNIGIDLALGVGGFPKGRIVEVFGPESSGKTTLCLHLAAEAQRLGGEVAFIDAEHALDPKYAKQLGVNTDELLISQPDYGEQALEIVDMLVASGGVSLIIVDSVAALTPKSEIDGEMGDSNVGKHARLMSQAMRKITANINRTKTTVIFTNQIREKIGVMFGSPETTPGGRALKFYSTIRIDIRKLANDKDNKTGEFVGNGVKVKVIKNKVAPPFREVELDLIYGKGFSNERAMLEIGVDYGVVKKNGAWYYDMNGEAYGQGLSNAGEALVEDPERAQLLREAIFEAFNPHDIEGLEPLEVD